MMTTLFAVPDFGVLAELAFEDADGARSADVVGHQDIGLDPYIVSGLHAGFAGRARQYFLCQRHRTSIVDEPGAKFNLEETRKTWSPVGFTTG